MNCLNIKASYDKECYGKNSSKNNANLSDVFARNHFHDRCCRYDAQVDIMLSNVTFICACHNIDLYAKIRQIYNDNKASLKHHMLLNN